MGCKYRYSIGAAFVTIWTWRPTKGAGARVDCDYRAASALSVQREPARGAKVVLCAPCSCLASRPASRRDLDFEESPDCRAAAPPCRGAFVCPGYIPVRNARSNSRGTTYGQYGVRAGQPAVTVQT